MVPSSCGIIIIMKGSRIIDDVPRLVDEEAFALSLKGSARAIAKAMADGSLFVVTRDGRKLYPSFFVDRTYEHRQLVAVIKLLADLDGFTQWQFFTTPKGSLGGLTPLAALRQRRFAAVKRAAEGFAQR